MIHHALKLTCVTFAFLVAGPSYADNIEPGDCDALKAHIKFPGVLDADMKPHPERAGWTLPRFDIAPHFRHTRSSASPGKFCFTATAHPQYTASPEIRTLTWQPTGCNQCGCDAERDRWMEGILGHEKHHADDYNGLVAKHNTLLANKKIKVRACYPEFDPNVTRQEAAKEFVRQVAVELEQDFEEFQRKAQNEADAYDAIAIGDNPQCDYCRSCAAGEAKQCDSCSTCNKSTGMCEPKSPACPTPTPTPLPTCDSGKVLLNGQCLTPCGEFVNGEFPDCGRSASDQPVVCCPDTLPGDSKVTFLCSSKKTSADCP